MMKNTKTTEKSYYSSRFVIKNLSEDGEGTFSGYASTSHKDYANDVILPGAFAQTLAQWNQEGCFPPVCWEHHPYKFIGICQELKEDERGLHIRGKLLLDVPKARKAYSRLQQGINGLSIGFFPEHTFTQKGLRHIAKLSLKEISFVDNPCNPEAKIYEYKNAHHFHDEDQDVDWVSALARLRKTLKV